MIGNVEQPLSLDFANGSDVVLRRENKLVINHPLRFVAKRCAWM